MKGLLHFLLLGIFAPLLSAEVMDFGDLKSYENKGEAPEGVHPDAIWVMPAEGGFTIALGEDLRKKMDGILGSCKEKDDKCFQDLNLALQDAHIQHEQRLESRIIFTATAIAAAFGVVADIIEATLAALAVVGGVMAISDDKGAFVPDEAASKAAKMPEATPITLSADGSAVATITKQPVATELDGKVTPSVTVVTQSSEGYEVDDLAAFIDPGMASYLNTFMLSSTDCEAGRKFDEEHPSRKRAEAGTVGSSLCAARAAMGGARPGGPFNDLLHLASTGAHFNFREAAGPVFAAANEMADFVREWAPMMALPEEIAQQVGNVMLALAVETIVGMEPLGEKNRIKGESVTVTATSESKPSSTSSGCPKPTDIICGYKDIEDCGLEIKGNGDDSKAVCKDTDLKGCECVAPGPSYVHIMPEEIYQAILAFKDIEDKPAKKEDKPKCSNDVTDLPTEVFSSSKSTVYNHFCKGWDKKRESKMTVDSLGENILPEPHLRKRTPPSKASDYVNFIRLDLSYKPNKDAADCKRDCIESFEDLTQFCSASSPGHYMYNTGKFDAGCGTFEYKVIPVEIEELKETSQTCNRSPSQWDEQANMGFLTPNIDSACNKAGLPDWSIKKDDKETFIQASARHQSLLYQVNISWREGCELENGLKQISGANPLGKTGVDHDFSCRKILERAYSKCSGNGGRGGTIQIGCLMYEASVTN